MPAEFETPSGLSPDPPASPPKRLSVSEAVALGASVLAVIAGAGLWYLSGELRRIRADYAQLDEQGRTLLQRTHDLQEEHLNLQQRYQELTVDRDNLFAQAKAALAARDEAEGVRNLLEKVLQRTGEENRLMSGRLPQLEQELQALTDERNALTTEREELERQLTKHQKRSEERKLRERLSTLRQREDTLERDLRGAQKELRDASGRASSLEEERAKLQERLDKLQSEYSEEVSTNASLRRQVERLPKDITTLAREHERLVKQLADTHYNLGVMFVNQKDFARAAQEFQQVVELEPDDADAYYNLGLIYAEHLPDRERAIKFFQRYLSVDPAGRDATYAKQYIATWRAWEAEDRLE